jgi:hypothetical protein
MMEFSEDVIESAAERKNLLGGWEDLGSVFLIEIGDFFGSEEGTCAVFSGRSGDQSCDETSGAGTCNQIKVVRQSSFCTIQSLLPNNKTPHTNNNCVSQQILVVELP